jgi:hypothetical protein
VGDYFDRLELELQGAVPRATSDPHAYPLTPLRSRRWPRPRNVVVGLSVAVTVAVVAVAVALVGHAHTTAHASPPASTAPATPVATRVDRNRHRISDVLAGDGIGRVKFGQSRVAVVAAVTRLLGPSSTGLLGPSSTGYMRVQAECGVDHAMTWVNYPVVSAYGKHYPLDPKLTVWFSHSRFVGYQYDEQGTKLAPRAPSLGTVLATTRGLTVGDKLSRGRQLYGAAFRTSTAQGGVFLISAPAGRIDGYAWGSPRYGDVSLQSLVATIDAGNVGCPALSP